MKTPREMSDVDSVEIISLQDNYIEITAQDNTAVISRASALRNGEICNSIQAEHGFSAIVKTTAGDSRRTMLFDFGFSPEGAASNAKTLGLDMDDIEIMVLSHGHSDHTGGIEALRSMIGRDRIKLLCHPAAFTAHRYLEPFPDVKLYFPRLSREALFEQNIDVISSEEPVLLPGNHVLFLGEIPRKTDFERGFPIAFRDRNGKKESDPIEDDSAVVVSLRGKGLVVISGCAHAGIINTVAHAKEVTGIEKIHAVMGGFHLSGPLFEPIIERTTEELLAMNPDYVIPCHCTGRRAIMHMERTMPDRFILNMSGTKLTFSA